MSGRYFSENVCMSSGNSQCGRVNILGVEKAQPHMSFNSNGYLGIGVGKGVGDQNNAL